jgi:hypothetical protein
MGPWPPVSPQYTHVLSGLRERGVAIVPDLVIAETAADVLAYFKTKRVVGADGGLARLHELPAGTTMAAYPLHTILENPDVLRLINSAPILRIAADYLGCRPTLSSVGVRWSFPAGKPSATTQLFHRDPDDWRFIKLFVYLTDVDSGAGPHSYVVRSFRTAGRIRSRAYSRGEIDRRFGRGALCTITGRRGTAFLADTHGIHAGINPTRTPRLILQAQYSLLPVFAFEYQSIVLQDTEGLDPYVNRLLIAQPRSAPRSSAVSA